MPVLLSSLVLHIFLTFIITKRLTSFCSLKWYHTASHCRHVFFKERTTFVWILLVIIEKYHWRRNSRICLSSFKSRRLDGEGSLDQAFTGYSHSQQAVGWRRQKHKLLEKQNWCIEVKMENWLWPKSSGESYSQIVMVTIVNVFQIMSNFLKAVHY